VLRDWLAAAAKSAMATARLRPCFALMLMSVPIRKEGGGNTENTKSATPTAHLPPSFALMLISVPIGKGGGGDIENTKSATATACLPPCFALMFSAEVHSSKRSGEGILKKIINCDNSSCLVCFALI